MHERQTEAPCDKCLRPLLDLRDEMAVEGLPCVGRVRRAQEALPSGDPASSDDAAQEADPVFVRSAAPPSEETMSSLAGQVEAARPAFYSGASPLQALPWGGIWQVDCSLARVPAG